MNSKTCHLSIQLSIIMISILLTAVSSVTANCNCDNDVRFCHIGCQKNPSQRCTQKCKSGYVACRKKYCSGRLLRRDEADLLPERFPGSSFY